MRLITLFPATFDALRQTGSHEPLATSRICLSCIFGFFILHILLPPTVVFDNDESRFGDSQPVSGPWRPDGADDAAEGGGRGGRGWGQRRE